MNKKPISYKQGDKRWGDKPYRVPGETSTIASAGCGPTCAAMVIASMVDKRITPESTCSWSIVHGYKALKQGTYYSYFSPQLAAYGIGCRQLLGSRIINQPSHPIHDQVKAYLHQGYWVIALMGPGTWTKGGHFVLIWDWDDKVRILDPASSADRRLNGDPATFRREARCYWLVDARGYNKKEDKRMDNTPSPAHKEGVEWCKKTGILQGDGSGNLGLTQNVTKQQLCTMLHRFAKSIGKA